LAIECLLDDRSHPRREPHHGLIVGDGAVPADFRQRLHVGDCPALEQQVAGFFLDERGWTVVAIGSWVDCKEY
jgi:hypothetical protein